MPKEENNHPNIQTQDSSIAIGGISIGGNVGNFRIGHTFGCKADQVSVLLTQIKTEFQPNPFVGKDFYSLGNPN